MHELKIVVPLTVYSRATGLQPFGPALNALRILLFVQQLVFAKRSGHLSKVPLSRCFAEHVFVATTAPSRS
jgi:hypothetical protein